MCGSFELHRARDARARNVGGIQIGHRGTCNRQPILRQVSDRHTCGLVTVCINYVLVGRVVGAAYGTDVAEAILQRHAGKAGYVAGELHLCAGAFHDKCLGLGSTIQRFERRGATAADGQRLAVVNV